MDSKIIGIAMQNFTAAPEMPDAQALIDYGIKMEELGYESVWTGEHVVLVDPHEPPSPVKPETNFIDTARRRSSSIRGCSRRRGQ